ncbi:receptor-type tyrosine-protein phosphatase T-like isoform X2 [Babylonia areolata]|uniref:receptor-type tyrosine-protein phosphatase T-like isoform X2 n=1 Tax=Babylonia areolata TaxID=304850 RepID=UPI003FD5EECA
MTMDGCAWTLYILLLLGCLQGEMGQPRPRHTGQSPDGLHNLMRRHCPSGFFGYRCRFRCRCLGNEECNKVTGTCLRGCAQGFWGPGCQLANRCYYNGQQRNYMGTVNLTEEGVQCQAWSARYPHDHTYKPVDFPDGEFPENFCRTTTDSSKPWCYSRSYRKRWGYCSIVNCGCPVGLFGHNCAKMCHCHDKTEKCDSILGMCRSGCDKGWTGFDCQTPAKCQSNRYGWACESQCHCQSDKHCHRFNGPDPECQCKEGYFNPPACEPVTKPHIEEFTSEKVNPGQQVVFNCTVSAFPVPAADEIRLQVPDGRQAILTRSVDVPSYGPYTRKNTFKVSYVHSGERYRCVVQGVAGTADKVLYSQVYELPRMNSPPGVLHGSITAHNATVEWRRWNPDRGDPGDPDILWYSVQVRGAGETSYRLAGIVYHTFCRDKCHFVLTKLHPNTRYSVYVSVRRDGEGGDGPPGPMIHLTTKCAVPSLPPAVGKLTTSLQYNFSQPLTRVMISWNPPPRNSINCNHIAKYAVVLSPAPDLGQPRIWNLPATNSRRLTIPGLMPFTKYCATVTFTTDGGFQSPASEKECAVTPQTIPPPPTNLKSVRITSRTVTMSWLRPDPPNGNITLYHIIYWEFNTTNTTTLKLQSDARYVEYTTMDLKPFSSYQIQVEAVNAAGTGKASSVLTVHTEEDVPGQVKDLHNVSRSERSIALQWQPPTLPGGRILHYTVGCDAQNTLLGRVANSYMQRKLDSGSESHTARELSPATQYLCFVKAHTSKGPGPAATLLVWTLAGDPRKPIAPVLKSLTDTTVTIDIHHSGDLSVSFYRLIVERLKEPDAASGVHHKQKRNSLLHLKHLNVTFGKAERLGLSAYVTAQLPSHEVSGSFTVGDNQTYEGFFNAPLQRDTAYDIWLVAFSEVDGTLKESFAKTESPVVVRALKAPPSASHMPVILGVLIVFVLLILTFAILLLLWKRRHMTPDEREKAELPSFGPTIFPEPDIAPPPTPISEGVCLYSALGAGSTEVEPLLEASSDHPVESDPVYSNVGAGLTMAPIKVEDLWDYIRNNKSNNMEGLKREHKMLPAGLTATCEVARREENKMKNRYGNIIAYDHTRVLLDPENDDFTDDYINANYINGYSRPRVYIAAQGPCLPTIKDIWRMIWKENSKTLIMLTNLTETGKKKCEQYWPEEGCEEYGSISVQLLDTDELPDFTIRAFLLSKGGQSKYVKQFHFTTWPDHGVPRFGHSLLLFRQKIRAFDSLDNGPVVVHCSAGVGRTGTYICIDTQLERARAEGILDVHNFVQFMRTQRVNMVQSFEQYMFVYDSLLEALICGDTTVSSHAFPEVYNDLCLFDPDIGKTKLEEQFEILKLLSTTIERDESTTALLPNNIFKNRCKNIVPANRCRPYLMTPYEGCNDYINAVFLNGYKRKDGLVATQMPLPNTVTDFWRLIYDHNCHTIVMLNDLDNNDETCEQYWTEDACGVSYGPFIVETTTQIRSDASFTLRDFTLTNGNMAQESPRSIRQFQFHMWLDSASVPTSGRAFLELVDAVEKWHEQTGEMPITVHCMNGSSRCGLLCAVLYILERMRKDKEVDVFQAVKQLRLNRTQFIDNMEQYKFCHDVLLEHLSRPSWPIKQS